MNTCKFTQLHIALQNCRIVRVILSGLVLYMSLNLAFQYLTMYVRSLAVCLLPPFWSRLPRAQSSLTR